MLFKDKPNNFNPKFEVVSCFIEVGDEILLLHRQDNKPQGGTWGVPAGKKDASESLEDTIKREIFEETSFGDDFSSLKYFDKVFVRYPTFDFVYHIFHLSLKEKPDIEINPTEHKDFLWKTPKDALEMNLIEDEDECIRLFYSVARLS